MAVYDTAENQRTKYTRETLACLADTVNLDRHRVVIVNNASCPETVELFRKYPRFDYIHIDRNIGTAAAINQAWLGRRPGENAVKMDNDVVIHQSDWADVLEDAIRLDTKIGICGLKRKDCQEEPSRTDWAHSEIYMLPHQPGERWIVVEEVAHVMGTCQMYSAALLEKIGYLYQPRLYGFDDSLAAVRCRVAGFKSVFLPCIEIDHIDPGDTPYQKWKERHAGEDMATYHEIVRQYRQGRRPIYFNPFEA